MDTQLFLREYSQLDALPETSSFCHGSFSDYDSDSSSPCSTNDGLDFLSFDVPEMFFPQDFDLPNVQPGVIPDADPNYCPLDDQLHSITPTHNVNGSTNYLEEYIKTIPPPSCMIPKQLPSCSVQGDTHPDFSAQRRLCHHDGGDPNVPGMHSGGLIPANEATALSNARMNNNMNSEERNSKPRNNSSQHGNEKNKKAKPTAKSTLRKHSIPDQMKDEKYWRRRLRNNWSARKSREAKRVKDRLIHDKISSLEDENNNLKMIIARLLAEKNSHQCMTSPWNNQIM